jgi:hypothetical protein
MNKTVSVVLTLAIVSIALLRCSKNPADNNDEPPAGKSVISGKVVNPDQTAAIGAVVSMVPVDYVPSLTLMKTSLPRAVTCTTDSKGMYRIYSIDSLCYNFEAHRDTCGVFCDSIKVVLDSNEHFLNDMTLHTLGRIYGVTKMPGQNDTNQVRVTLYIPGTRRITKPAIGGAFMFDQVPAGNYQLIIDPTLNTYNVKVLDITLSAGQDLNLDTITLNVYEPDTIVINQPYVYGTWGPGKVYILLSGTDVVTNQSLTILPGTTVKFYGPIFLNSSENNPLYVRGKPDSLVIFEPGLSSGAKTYSMTHWNEDSTSDTTLFMNWVLIKGIGSINILCSRGVFISNCIFIKCGTPIKNEGCGSIPLRTVSNCVFWNNDNVFESARDPYISIVNSIFYGNTTCFVGDTFPDFSHCLFFNNLSTPPDSISPNCLFTDPLFVSLDTLNPDFHLQQPGSPCLGTGLGGADIGLYDSH